MCIRDRDRCTKALSLPGAAAGGGGSPAVPGVVRTCRSQENYFELSDMICVDIDIDENLASSVDALHYRESVVSRASDSSGSVDAVELDSGDPGLPPTTSDGNRTVVRSIDSPEELSCSTHLRSADDRAMSTAAEEGLAKFYQLFSGPRIIRDIPQIL